MTAAAPLRNAGVTPDCPVCGARLSGRRRFCSAGCRQAAWRRRRQQPAPAVLEVPAGASSKPLTVYECPSCQTRLLGQQRCPDCQLFCRRLGLGGLCPHCDEPVTLTDLGLSAALAISPPEVPTMVS